MHTSICIFNFLFISLYFWGRQFIYGGVTEIRNAWMFIMKYWKYAFHMSNTWNIFDDNSIRMKLTTPEMRRREQKQLVRSLNRKNEKTWIDHKNKNCLVDCRYWTHRRRWVICSVTWKSRLSTKRRCILSTKLFNMNFCKRCRSGRRVGRCRSISQWSDTDEVIGTPFEKDLSLTLCTLSNEPPNLRRAADEVEAEVGGAK